MHNKIWGRYPALAQLVEHSTVVVSQCYRIVAGSIPASRNKGGRFQYAYCGCLLK
jgi:hypothetical protein